MNVCIVTVYNSENCGSFYQAYALSKTLESMGHKVFFLERETEGTSHDLLTKYIESLRAFLHGHPVLAINNIRRYYAFDRAISSFKIIKNNNESLNNIDCIVIGSDTVWNFADPYFESKKEIYAGTIFPEKKKVAYAVSLANTEYSTVLEDDIIRDSIEKCDAIAVRDIYTQKCVELITKKEHTCVLDPTLLLDESDYERLEKSIPHNNYVLIYGFKEIDKKIINELKALKITIISYGKYRKWADINLIYNPSTFLSYFKNAEFIITDTFHGTIFSIIYKKRFVCYGQEKKKVVDLLENLGLKGCFITSQECLSEKIAKFPDYNQAYIKLNKMKTESIEYLKENV